MRYFILILVNNRSSIINEENILKALLGIGYANNDEKLRKQFEKIITYVVVKSIQTEEEIAEIVDKGMIIAGKTRNWDLILTDAKLVDSSEINRTVNVFKRIKIQMQASNKGANSNVILPRVTFITDRPFGETLSWNSFFYRYGYTNICCNTIKHLQMGLLTEIRDLINNRKTCNPIDDIGVNEAPTVKSKVQIEKLM